MVGVRLCVRACRCLCLCLCTRARSCVGVHERVHMYACVRRSDRDVRVTLGRARISDAWRGFILRVDRRFRLVNIKRRANTRTNRDQSMRAVPHQLNSVKSNESANPSRASGSAATMSALHTAGQTDITAYFALFARAIRSVQSRMHAGVCSCRRCFFVGWVISMKAGTRKSRMWIQKMSRRD